MKLKGTVRTTIIKTQIHFKGPLVNLKLLVWMKVSKYDFKFADFIGRRVLNILWKCTFHTIYNQIYLTIRYIFEMLGKIMIRLDPISLKENGSNRIRIRNTGLREAEFFSPVSAEDGKAELQKMHCESILASCQL